MSITAMHSGGGMIRNRDMESHRKNRRSRLNVFRSRIMFDRSPDAWDRGEHRLASELSIGMQHFRDSVANRAEQNLCPPGKRVC
jgi:hypothetical protein